MAKTVTVEIDADGNFTVDMAGFQGKGCKDVAKAFDAAGKVTKETLKPEYHQGGGNQNTITTGH
jgi:hypothetical protein